MKLVTFVAPVVFAILLAAVVGAARADDAGVRIAIPPENAASLREPPARPAFREDDPRARALFDAILADDPDRAESFFFPAEAFDLVKAMATPRTYWNRLHRRYAEDIHALHRSLGRDAANATFVRLELARRGGWMRAGEEGNALPYWASRHSRMHYRVGAQARTFEVRVLITWGATWYVIHLSEFR